MHPHTPGSAAEARRETSLLCVLQGMVALDNTASKASAVSRAPLSLSALGSEVAL